jgi:hypothetical protein
LPSGPFIQPGHLECEKCGLVTFGEASPSSSEEDLTKLASLHIKKL